MILISSDYENGGYFSIGNIDKTGLVTPLSDEEKEKIDKELEKIDK